MACVRSIDVGYGLCKYIAARSDGTLGCNSFPSVFPMAVDSQVGSEFLGTQRAVEIAIANESGEETRFLVGPKAAHFLGPRFARPLDKEFPCTTGYLALIRGCLHFINEPVIDLLMVGLPLTTYKAKKAALRNLLLGDHRLGGKRQTRVKDVLVVPQPAGALFYLLDKHGHFASLRKDRSLVIDPGYLTLDFVAARGTEFLPQYCGAHEGGVSSILRRIAERVNAQFGTRITEYLDIDEAIMGNQPLRVGGHAVDLRPYLPAAEELAHTAVNYMDQVLHGADQFQHIFLVGGGARWFRKAIKAKYPNRTIEIAEDPIFANVLGYQIIGTGRLQLEQQRRSAAGVAP